MGKRVGLVGAWLGSGWGLVGAGVDLREGLLRLLLDQILERRQIIRRDEPVAVDSLALMHPLVYDLLRRLEAGRAGSVVWWGDGMGRWGVAGYLGACWGGGGGGGGGAYLAMSMPLKAEARWRTLNS